MNYSKRFAEILSGLIILSIVLIFILYVFFVVINKSNSSYVINVKFNEIGGLSTGSQVLMKGVVVGSVNKIAINKHFKVDVYLNINSDIKIPIDSTVFIKDTSLFSGRKIEICPGASNIYVKDKGKLINTVDYRYLEDKISTMFFNKG